MQFNSPRYFRESRKVVRIASCQLFFEISTFSSTILIISYMYIFWSNLSPVPLLHLLLYLISNTFPSQFYMLFLFYFLTFWAHLVLLVFCWMDDHLLEQEYPLRGCNPKNIWLFIRLPRSTTSQLGVWLRGHIFHRHKTFGWHNHLKVLCLQSQFLWVNSWKRPVVSSKYCVTASVPYFYIVPSLVIPLPWWSLHLEGEQGMMSMSHLELTEKFLLTRLGENFLDRGPTVSVILLAAMFMEFVLGFWNLTIFQISYHSHSSKVPVHNDKSYLCLYSFSFSDILCSPDAYLH